MVGGIYTTRRLILLVQLSVAMLALGSCAKPKPQHAYDDEVVTPTAPASPYAERQTAVCETVAKLATDCAVANAKATLSERELEELELDKVAPIQVREMTSKCSRSALSLRQVEVYEACVERFASCDAFIRCMDAAAPKRSEQAQ